jgi:glucosylceramidase
VFINSDAFTPQLERDFIKLNLGPTLHANGYGNDKLKLLIGDDQRPAFELTLGNHSVPSPSVYDWAQTIFGDNDVNRYVSGVDFHWYFNTPNNTNVLDQTYDSYPDYFMLSTEACNGAFDDLVLLGSWLRGESYAIDIIEVFIA